MSLTFSSRNAPMLPKQRNTTVNLLIDRHAALSIYLLIITTPSTVVAITCYTGSLPADSPRLTLLHLPNDDPPPAADGDFSLIETQKPRVREVVSAAIGRFPDGARLAGFVLDMFCTSIVDVAEEFGVPSFIFFTSPASILDFILHIQTSHDGDEGFEITEFEGTELVVPSWANPISRWAFPNNVVKKELIQSFYRIARDFMRTKGTLVNSVKELESCAVDALSSFPKVYPVGPILNLKGDGDGGTKKEEVIEWLDRQPESTVVFLYFGSMGAFREEQVREIANGLEVSGQSLSLKTLWKGFGEFWPYWTGITHL
ncbi:unnamed protein product [Linum trigynum]